MGAQAQEEIREYCRQLKLNAIGGHFEEVISESSDYEDFLHRLLMMEIENSNQRLITRRTRAAHFPFNKYLEDLETDCLPEDLRNKLPGLSTLDFIKNHQNIIMTGNPGTGKTHTAIGLGMKACEEGYRVLFVRIPDLLTELKESNDAKKLRAYERRFKKYDLVIADELGYINFQRDEADLFFNCLSQRATEKSTIITSNLTFDRWDEVFGDPAITSAIVDRLTYRAFLIDMEGDSYRLRETLRQSGKSIEYVKKATEKTAAGL